MARKSTGDRRLAAFRFDQGRHSALKRSTFLSEEHEDLVRARPDASELSNPHRHQDFEQTLTPAMGAM